MRHSPEAFLNTLLDRLIRLMTLYMQSFLFRSHLEKDFDKLLEGHSEYSKNKEMRS